MCHESATRAATTASLAWKGAHGPGSVLGLAPSAGAAEVLSSQIGVDTENTAKMVDRVAAHPQLAAARDRLTAQLARHPYPGSASAQRIQNRLCELDAAISVRRLRADELVIVDEASLAGTLDLDELTSAARSAGAKILLTGDRAQLSAVDAGRAFHLLACDASRPCSPTFAGSLLTGSDRPASSSALATRRLSMPTKAGRIVEGSRKDLLDRVYQGWKGRHRRRPGQHHGRRRQRYRRRPRPAVVAAANHFYLKDENLDVWGRCLLGIS